MKPKLLLLSLIVIHSLCIKAQPNQRVTLYSDCSYSGKSQLFNPGQYYLSQSSIGSKQVSSIKIPYGMKVVLYTGSVPGSGSNLSLSTDVNCLNSYNWNDKAVTMIVEITDLGNNNNYNNQKGVTLYKDCNYSGSTVSLGPGNYNTNELGIGNDVLSSLKISNGFSITLYEDASFNGKSIVYKDDVSCLGFSWNNRVSSVRITREGGWNNPGGNNSVATLYQDCNYKGSSKILGTGYFNVDDIGIDNDALSSIRIDNGYTITVYENKDYKGRSATYYNDLSCMPSDWNDKVSSVYITRSGGNNNNYNYNAKITLYEDCYYEGKKSSMGVGYYNLSQLGISNDALSSLRIPSGYSVTLYKDDKQKGLQTTITGDTPCLASYWNDKVSSIRVFRTGY